jgi:hypothetical protein
VSAPSPRDFSVIDHKKNHSPYYVTGLVDGEGSFGLYLAKNSSTRSGYQIQATFHITLHKNDYALLEMVKEFFGVGGIYKDGDRYIKYSVRSLKDLAIIIKHFEEYPLRTQKRADFELFKDSVQLMLNRSHITEEGLKKIISLKASMNKGLSCSLKSAFPNVVPVPIPLVLNISSKAAN